MIKVQMMETTTHKPVFLLVEDSDDDAFFFNRTFQKSGIEGQIHHVVNGSAAIEFLRSAADAKALPKLIFLDLKMPVLNGFEVLAWMQQQPGFASISTVVLSGSDEQRDKERSRELGASGYLVKPATVPDMLRLAEEIFAPEKAGGRS